MFAEYFRNHSALAPLPLQVTGAANPILGRSTRSLAWEDSANVVWGPIWPATQRTVSGNRRSGLEIAHWRHITFLLVLPHHGRLSSAIQWMMMSPFYALLILILWPFGLIIIFSILDDQINLHFLPGTAESVNSPREHQMYPCYNRTAHIVLDFSCSVSLVCPSANGW